MNKEFFEALELLEKENGIPKEYMLEKVEAALMTAFKRETDGSTNVRVAVDSEKKTIKLLRLYNVVETVEDPESEMNLEQAKKVNRRLGIGDVAEVEVKTKNFGRVSAMTAKNVIVQGIREAEREKTIKEYEDKKDDIITARVVVVDAKTGNAILEVGRKQATLMKSEQIPGERLRGGQHIKVLVTGIKTDTREPVVILSRAHQDFVKRIFELEVPEIKDGTIVIKSIAREAGSRTKIAVLSRNPDVDAIGACIGVKGLRKNNILSELAGEKVDIINYNESPEEYIKAALSPASVISVSADDEAQNSYKITVPADQLSLAIGKEGQNVRLAARLTGCKIDIKPAE